MESAAAKDRWESYHQPSWSRDEKEVAREAFERAKHGEIEKVIRDVKRKVAKIKNAWELWELEAYLAEQRREIDRKYDYRYSVLPVVFGQLIREKRLNERDLYGLSQDKIKMIRTSARG